MSRLPKFAIAFSAFTAFVAPVVAETFNSRVEDFYSRVSVQPTAIAYVAAFDVKRSLQLCGERYSFTNFSLALLKNQKHLQEQEDVVTLEKWNDSGFIKIPTDYYLDEYKSTDSNNDAKQAEYCAAYVAQNVLMVKPIPEYQIQAREGYNMVIWKSSQSEAEAMALFRAGAITNIYELVERGYGECLAIENHALAQVLDKIACLVRR